MLTSIAADNPSLVFDLIASLPKDIYCGGALRVSALLRAYGTGYDFFGVYYQAAGAFLARLETSFFLCAAPGADFDEIAAFLALSPDFGRLVGTADAVEAVAARLPGRFLRRRFALLALRDDSPPRAGGFPVDAAPRLSDVYDLLTAADFEIGPFAPWYADLSHRIRHGFADAFLLYEDGVPVSGCVTAFRDTRAGLVGGVATRPGFRGRGYASAAVRAACTALLQDGLTPCVECAPDLLPFYQTLGFEKIGETAELSQPHKPHEL